MTTKTASSNWLALQKKIGPSERDEGRRKRRKLDHASSESPSTHATPSAFSHHSQSNSSTNPKNPHAAKSLLPSGVDPSLFTDNTIHNNESLSHLRKLVFGLLSSSSISQLHDTESNSTKGNPKKYLAVDCEMVGVGPDGSESSLARVSLVDWNGGVVLDEFVKQKERVTDWRTQWSGIRERDMIHAKSFEEVQKMVADLTKDRILIGHAIHNDLKALLLSHPRPLIRDTQHLAHKHGQSRGARPALRNLVRDMFAVPIQAGEHSSVTDARATMAIYRLHRKQWEQAYSVVPIRVRAAKAEASTSPVTTSGQGKKRHRGADGDASDSEEDNGAQEKEKFPGGGRKGVSSGLSVVVRRGKGTAVPITHGRKGEGGSASSGREKAKWWKELGGGKGGGSKGVMKLTK